MNKNGFTVIELMVTLTVFAIITAIAAPSFRNILKQQEVNGQINTLVSVIYRARSEAIKRNKVVTVCKSANEQSCGGRWSDGWLMFVDQNADGDKEAGESKISAGSFIDGYEITWSAFGSNNYIRFMRNGLTVSQNGTFKICPESQDERIARAVFISKTSRVRTSKDSNKDGIDENASTENLNCD